MKRLIALTLGALLIAGVPMVYADRGDRDRGKDSEDLVVTGITADGRLIAFKDDAPGKARTIGKVSGLADDTKLVGVDFRPASGNTGGNGDLYGLGDKGGVYKLSLRNAAATLVSRLDVALNGSSFGVDFNPTVDRLRVFSDTGQNLRVNVDTGATTVDGTLSYTPPTAATGVTGAAYTNNDNDAGTATTLFDIDTALDQVAIQSPANSGQLVSTGKLSVDVGAATGSDIYSTVRSGTTKTNTALASLVTGGRTSLYEVNLLTGRVSSQGSFSSKDSVTGIAIPLNQK